MTSHFCIQKCCKVQTWVARIPNVNSPFDRGKREEGKIRPSSVPPPPPQSTLSCLCGRASEQPSSALQCQTGRKPGRPSMDFMFLSAHGRTHSCTETPTNKQTGGQAGRRQRQRSRAPLPFCMFRRWRMGRMNDTQLKFWLEIADLYMQGHEAAKRMIPS